jgi:hypothetical protein
VYEERFYKVIKYTLRLSQIVLFLDKNKPVVEGLWMFTTYLMFNAGLKTWLGGCG